MQRKVERVLQQRLDSKELIKALQGLSDFYTENTMHNRRRLRTSLEKKDWSLMDELTESFQGVVSELEKVTDAISSLQNECKEVGAKLSKAEEETNALVELTREKQARIQVVEAKEKIVNTFLQRFHLSPEENALLESLESDDCVLSDELFKVFDRIEQIREDCKSLMKQYHQSAGLDIMERLGRRLETGYERVYRWVQKHSKTLEVHMEEVGVDSTLFRKALRILRNRSVYYRHCVQEIGATRRVVIVRRFIQALTRGDGGSKRPIEIHAHDPVRYVSDMVAWVHQAVATEKEFSSALLYKELGELERSTHDQKKDVIELIDRVMEGLCTPLDVRVSQALLSNMDIVTRYKLANVLDFYTTTIGSLVGTESRLESTLHELRTKSYKKFFSQLRITTDRLVKLPPPYTVGLTPPIPFKELLQKLEKILGIYHGSLAPKERQSQGLSNVLSAILDPLIDSARRSADGLDSSDSAVYMINITTDMQATLAKFSFTRDNPRYETMSLGIENQLETLISSQTEKILAKCGVSALLRELERAFDSEHEELVLADPYLAPRLKTAVKTYCNYIFSLGALAMPQIDRVSTPDLRKRTRQGVARTIADAYRLLYKAVNSNPELSQSQEITKYTPEQVFTIIKGNL